jgi:hypothetical protein
MLNDLQDLETISLDQGFAPGDTHATVIRRRYQLLGGPVPIYVLHYLSFPVNGAYLDMGRYEQSRVLIAPKISLNLANPKVAQAAAAAAIASSPKGKAVVNKKVCNAAEMKDVNVPCIR